MPTITPTWTDNVEVIAAATVAFGEQIRGTLDLRSKVAARLFIGIGMKGTTVPSADIRVRVRPLINNGASQAGGGAALGLGYSHGPSGTIAATTVDTDSAAGQSTLQVAAVTNFAADEQIAIYDDDGETFARLEFARLSKPVAGTNDLILESLLLFAHTAAQADEVYDNAFCKNLSIDGGSLWEVIIDYGESTSGSNVVVAARAQTLDSYESA